MIKKIIALFLAVITLCLVSCNKSVSPDENTEQSEISAVNIDGLLIAENGESEYVLVCDLADSIGKAFAKELVNLFFTNYGIALNIKNSDSQNEKEIIVGNVARESTAAVKSQMEPENDYAIVAVDDDIVLYATDRTQYAHLMFTLRDYVLSQNQKMLVYGTGKDFIASKNPDMIFNGNEVTVLDNGVSDYRIVYSETDKDSEKSAMYLQKYFREKLGIRLLISTDKNSAEHEMIIKGSSRSTVRNLTDTLDTKDDFAAYVVNDDIVLTATDNKMMMLCMMKFISMCTDKLNGGTVKISEIENYMYSKEGRSIEYNAEEYCDRYQSAYNTFSTRNESILNNNSMSAARNDQKLVEALVKRMGTSFAVKHGSSSVLYDGFVRKLDTADYTRSAIIEGNTVKIPVEFAQSYFGESVTVEAGYVDVTAYCNASDDYSVYIFSDGELAIITPKSVVSFENQNVKQNGYTNKQYCERMKEFFASTVFPEPGVNTEQSRVVLEYIQYPDNVLDYSTEEYQTTFSPSILVVKEGEDTVYYVSYEVSTLVTVLESNGDLKYDERSVYTVLKKSTDGGSTWTTVVEKIPNLRWASLFENKGVIYLIGSDIYTWNASIAKIGANGTYEQNTGLFSRTQVSGTCPGTVLHANGRIYKAYLAATISADEDADLLDKNSWTISNKTNSDELAKYGNEGSMVLGKDGAVYQLMHTDKINESIVLKLSADGTTYSHVSGLENGYIDFPTCVSKNSVIYDDVSGKYIALSNVCNTTNARQRNILALVVSDDLIHWEIAEYILVDREMINPIYSGVCHAFQYTDFKIDGGDIVLAVREAAGYTNTYHDGNYCTFYRISNFRDLLDNARGEYPTGG